jgi:hypothetical protein
MKKMPLHERFFSKVDKKDSCWIWTGARDAREGYGVFWYQGRSQRAHRVSWEIHFGSIPDGMKVCHKCDTPSCVNPSHFFLGTDADNVADRNRKGRQAHLRCEQAGNSKLTEQQVKDIRNMYANGNTQRGLARIFKVSQHAIWCIVHNRTWVDEVTK